MLKKLIIFLSFFFVSALPAFACTATVDNPNIYSGLINTVNFTIIPAVNSPAGTYVQFSNDQGRSSTPYFQWGIPINAPVTSNGVTFAEANQPQYYNGDITYVANQDLIAGTPYTIPVYVQGNNIGSGMARPEILNAAEPAPDCNDVTLTTIPSPNPTVNPITVATSPTQVNTPITASASFTDPDTSDIAHATWDWGDGTPTNPDTTTGTVTESNGSGTVGADSHTYTTAGVYTITLTVTNNLGGTATQIYQYVSVYNPTAQGLFSAAHLFSSPAGAYPQNSSLTGNVTFGLSYKYQGTMPVGDRQFIMNFKDANLLFNATTVSSLVIANNVATLTGTGTINGTGTYNFVVVGVNGGNIRVQITDSFNNVIYDTQPGAAITATPTTSVTGNVIAHN